MILNLRRLQDVQDKSLDKRIGSIPGLNFSTSAFLGNIGAPLRDSNEELEDNLEETEGEPPNEVTR